MAHTDITLADVESAAARLRGVAIRTPLLVSAELDDVVRGKVLIKPECLQRTGSFKIRGAYNLMSKLDAEQAARGVVAWSSGNHAQGVAAAGSLLGIRTAIVMPEDSPAIKIERTRAYGGETVLYDRYTGDREAIARDLAAKRGAELVPSYDHPDIIAGQGTVGLEIVEQSAEIGAVPDQVLICCGGGGLSAGSAIAMKAHWPDCDVYVVEPRDFDDTTRSLQIGARVANSADARSFCDALQASMPGEMTFPINQRLSNGGLTVSDAEVGAAMRFACQNLKLVTEPGGAVALAAVLAEKVELRGKTTVVVISGGNVDRELFAAVMRQSD